MVDEHVDQTLGSVVSIDGQGELPVSSQLDEARHGGEKETRPVHLFGLVQPERGQDDLEGRGNGVDGVEQPFVGAGRVDRSEVQTRSPHREAEMRPHDCFDTFVATTTDGRGGDDCFECFEAGNGESSSEAIGTVDMGIERLCTNAEFAGDGTQPHIAGMSSGVEHRHRLGDDVVSGDPGSRRHANVLSTCVPCRIVSDSCLMVTDILEFLDIGTDDPVELMSMYASHGWGDGLPLIPPTPERVDTMLQGCAGTDLDEVIAVLPPRSGQATRRMIAVNAVLAGCAADQLPVLVSAVRALADPQLNLRGVNATTHPVAPLLIVHGSVAAAGGYNAGLGAFGPGNRANATTGRALRLILLHIAGATPGPGDVATQGGPAKYSYCVAENLEDSPWGSYAADAGVDAPSALTIHCGEAPHNVHDMESAAPEAILDKIASAMTSTGQNNAPISQGEYFVVLCPEHAATCAAAGWSRSHVASYLHQKARMTVGELKQAFALRAWAPWQQALGDDELMAMTEHPDNIKVLVVGGPGKHSCVIPSWGMTKSVTVPVLP